MSPVEEKPRLSNSLLENILPIAKGLVGGAEIIKVLAKTAKSLDIPAQCGTVLKCVKGCCTAIARCVKSCCSAIASCVKTCCSAIGQLVSTCCSAIGGLVTTCCSAIGGLVTTCCSAIGGLVTTCCSAIGGLVTTSVTAIASSPLAPIVLGVAAVAGGGYLLMKGISWLRN